MAKTMWLGGVVAMALVGGCAVDEELASVEQEASTDVWHATWNGGNANASFYAQYGGGFIDTFEYKSGQNRTAYLNLSMWQIDPTSEHCYTEDWGWGPYTWCWYTRSTYTSAWGQVPAKDVRITAATASIHTTLPATFGGYQCTWDWDTFTGGCTSIAGGNVDVTWHKDGWYTAFQSGTQQQSYGPYTFKTQGTFRSTSATAAGNVLGVDFQWGSGYFGDTRGVNVTKSIIPTTNP